MARAYYQAPVHEFLTTSAAQIVGQIVPHHGQDIVSLQTAAWFAQIEILKSQLSNLNHDAYLFFEFSIPRMGKRADCILVLKGVIFVLEFKIGAARYLYADREQVEGYALDLKHFHRGSHHKPIIPILIASKATEAFLSFQLNDELVARAVCLAPERLRSFLLDAVTRVAAPEFDALQWSLEAYQPTPTIVEAAQALYANHQVEEISRSEAGADDIQQTSRTLMELIHQARTKQQKIICFVTGVPGAGKTLVGLNIANQHADKDDAEFSVFLSGNGPLVAVLQEALARDQRVRTAVPCSIGGMRQRTKAFIAFAMST